MDQDEFQRACLGMPFWARQNEVFDEYIRGRRKVLVRSGNGLGKTALLATIALHAFETNERIKVLTLSKTFSHLKNNLWAEIRRQARRSGLWDKYKFNKTDVAAGGDRQIIGLTPNVVESAQGFHSTKVLVLADEASGIPPDIFDALLSNMTGEDQQIICCFNPIDPTSYVDQAEETGDWHTIGMSAFEHPNVVQNREIIPGAVTRTFVETSLKSWSKLVDASYPDAICVPWDNSYWEPTPQALARICGKRTLAANLGFIDWDIIRDSVENENIDGRKYVGIDCSRGSNDASFGAVVIGNSLERFVQFDTTNLSVLARRISEDFGKEYTIAIDDTGLGSGVTDRLRDIGREVFAVNFSERPRGFFKGTSKPYNAKTEMYLLVEQDLRKKELRLINDSELFRELSIFRIVPVRDRNAVRVEDKANLRKKLGRSPDRSDALVLANYARHLHKFHNRKVLT